MNICHIDIETKSGYNLIDVGVYKYVTHEDFQVLIASIDYNGNKARIDFTKEEIPEWYKSIMLNKNIQKWAFNAQFERICISAQLGYKYIDPESWYCSQAHSFLNGCSGTLAGCELLLNGVVNKDPIGKKLIRQFSIPPYQKPEGQDWEMFKNYCDKDVIAEMALKPEHNDFDHELYWVNERINDRGLQIDLKLVNDNIQAIKGIQEKARIEAQKMGLKNPNSQPQKMKWFKDNGLTLSNVQAGTLESVQTDNITINKMIELLQTLGSSTVKKYKKILQMVDGDRLKGQFIAFKALSYRFAGTGVQVHNLNRGYSSIEDIENAMQNIDSIYKSKSLVRACFIGNLMVADFAGIEARVLAWLSDFDEKLNEIRSGIDLYKKNATKLYNTSYEDVTKDQRKVGKTMELALGYQGWVNAMIAFNADKFMQLHEIKTAIEIWRINNTPIVTFWADMERTAKLAIQYKTAFRVNRHIYFEYKNSDLLMYLPNNISIVYKNAKLENAYGRVQISYQTNKGNLIEKKYTYGGKLVENATQSVAFFLLRNSLINLHNAGYDIIAHIHDEILVEKKPNQTLDKMIDIMTVLPDWAEGLPLNAEGWTGNRYRKE